MSGFGFRTRNGLIYSMIQGLESVPGVLDLYPNASAAYSLRRLNSSYIANAIRVRRSSDNSELDIGFDISGDLNIATLTSFVGSGNGFITRWYDQSGNSLNATQTTAANQPSIVTAGVLETQLNKPCVRFSRVTSHGLATSVTVNNPFSIISVMSQDLTTVAGTRMLNSTAAGTNSIISIKRNDGLSVYTGSVVLGNFPFQNSNQPYLISFLRQTSTSYIYQDASIVPNTSTLSTGWGGFEMSTPTFGTGEAFAGKISEVIIYPVNQNSVVSAIHSNINSYYSIF